MTRNRNWIRWLGGLVALALIISVVALLFETNPPVKAEPAWDSPQTKTLAQRSCFDCHSNQTSWPWFTRVPPGSWLAAFDTVSGRRVVNFSEWAGPASVHAERGSGVDAVVRVVNDGSMPPGIYLLMHPNAALSAADKQQLALGFQNSLK